MKKIVVKFGGSNLREKEDLSRITSIVKAYDRPLVVVVSAFYGITNFLSSQLEKAPGDRTRAKEITRFLQEFKTRIIEENFTTPETRSTVLSGLEKRLLELERYIKGVHYIGETPDFLHDHILSYGERLSSYLITRLLIDRGIDAEEALPENIGLVTDGNHKSAQVDIEASRGSVCKALSKDKVYLVPGFYGISPENRTTLLGRGGSDYSAAALAGCLGAESLDLWKDVDGFLSGHPELVDSPQPIPRLSYDEAAELSYFGAGILHPQSVEPLEKDDIPLRIFNIRRSEEGILPRTRIDREGNGKRGVKSITFSDDFAILTLFGPSVGNEAGILARVTTALNNRGINIKSVVTAQTAINLYLSEADIEKSEDCISKLAIPSVQQIVKTKDLAVLALVGKDLYLEPEIYDRFIRVLSESGIKPRILSTGASPSAAYLLVRKERCIEGLRILHRNFFDVNINR